jgi:hypothetical protein
MGCQLKSSIEMKVAVRSQRLWGSHRRDFMVAYPRKKKRDCGSSQFELHHYLETGWYLQKSLLLPRMIPYLVNE